MIGILQDGFYKLLHSISTISVSPQCLSQSSVTPIVDVAYSSMSIFSILANTNMCSSFSINVLSCMDYQSIPVISCSTYTASDFFSFSSYLYYFS